MQKGWYEKLSDLCLSKDDLTNVTFDCYYPFMALARWWLIEDIDQDRLLSFTKILLERKDIDVNAKDDLGWTALAYAARYHGPETRFIELLLKHPDIDVNCQDNNGWTPLMNACRYVVQGESCFAVVKMLLGHRNINPNIQNTRSKSALFFSARYGDIETYKEVLYHRDTTTLLNDNTSVEHLIHFCRNSPDFSKKVFFAMKCRKMNFANLWVHACRVGPITPVGKQCLSILCSVLKHDRITKLNIPALMSFRIDLTNNLFKNILTGIQKCKSLQTIHILCKNTHTIRGKLVMEAIYSNLSVSNITRPLLTKELVIDLGMNDELSFLYCNREAHEKCYKATIFVLWAFKTILTKDLAKLIAKFVWASDGTGVWHEKGYISLGERQRKLRLRATIAK